MSTHTKTTSDQKVKAPELRLETLQDYSNDNTTIPLPEINLAMHPGQVCFGDDVSDKSQFNERFIESRVHEGMNAFVLYLAAMVHNVMFITIITLILYEIVNGTLDLFEVIGSLVVYAVFSFGPSLAFKSAALYPFRFNRQAQMIHYPISDDKVLNIPWREAKPYMRLGRVASGSHNLMVLFPDPDNPGDPNNPNVVETSVAFDGMDFTSAQRNYERLEFIRRYMESGLDAIQPCQELIDAGQVHKPTGYDKSNKFWSAPFYNLSMGLFYILGTGPLVDRWVKKQVHNFKWPEEVERLCAEGADLSGIDTTSVKARTDRYYEFHGIGNLIFVDANRNRVQ